MKLDDQVNQLTELLADLVPTVDRLSRVQEKTNVELSEMRTSNMKLADAIEKLVIRMDRATDLEKRIERLEKIVNK